MAKATKYFVIDPHGVEHTRTSQRTYTHAVLFRVNVKAYRANIDAGRDDKIHVNNHKYFSAMVACGFSDRTDYTEAEKAKYSAIAAMTVEDHIAAERVQEIDRLNRLYGLGDLGKDWFCAGWCGRPDLAQKLLAKEQVSYPECIILEAQTK